MIARVVAGEPDVVVLVDENAVLGLRPIVTFARPAPGAVELAVLVELEHRWRRGAAFGGRRFLHRALLVVDKRRRTLEHPNVVVSVDRDVGDLPEDLVAGQGLGPERVDLKARRLIGARGREGERKGGRRDTGERDRLDDAHFSSLVIDWQSKGALSHRKISHTHSPEIRRGSTLAHFASQMVGSVPGRAVGSTRSRPRGCRFWRWGDFDAMGVSPFRRRQEGVTRHKRPDAAGDHVRVTPDSGHWADMPVLP